MGHSNVAQSLLRQIFPPRTTKRYRDWLPHRGLAMLTDDRLLPSLVFGALLRLGLVKVDFQPA